MSIQRSSCCRKPKANRFSMEDVSSSMSLRPLRGEAERQSAPTQTLPYFTRLSGQPVHTARLQVLPPPASSSFQVVLASPCFPLGLIRALPLAYLVALTSFTSLSGLCPVGGLLAPQLLSSRPFSFLMAPPPSQAPPLRPSFRPCLQLLLPRFMCSRAW